MNRTGFFVLCLALVCPDVKGSELSQERIQELVKSAHEQHSLVGVQAAVSVDGGPILKSNHGFANLEHRVPVTDKTRFRIASIAKSFAGIVFLRLEQRGVISRDDLISKWVPELPNPRRGRLLALVSTHDLGVALCVCSRLLLETERRKIGPTRDPSVAMRSEV